MAVFTVRYVMTTIGIDTVEADSLEKAISKLDPSEVSYEEGDSSLREFEEWTHISRDEVEDEGWSFEERFYEDTPSGGVWKP